MKSLAHARLASALLAGALLAAVLASGQCAAQTAAAATVFDGYEAFYGSLPQALFLATQARPLTRAGTGRAPARLQWEGLAGDSGPRHQVELAGADLRIDGRRLPAAKARKFGNEMPTALGERATLYVNDSAVCVEGVAPSASGTAQRHVHVSLVTQAFGPKALRYELPSLFASCLGLYRGEGASVRFYQASYHYPAGQDEADGLALQPYVLDSGNWRTEGAPLRTQFVEPGNVYRFTLTQGN